MSASVWRDLEFSEFAEAIARPWSPTAGSPALAARRECVALSDAPQPCERLEHELPYSPVFALPRIWLLKPMSNTTGSQPDASRQRFSVSPGCEVVPIRTRILSKHAASSRLQVITMRVHKVLTRDTTFSILVCQCAVGHIEKRSNRTQFPTSPLFTPPGLNFCVPQP